MVASKNNPGDENDREEKMSMGVYTYQCFATQHVMHATRSMVCTCDSCLIVAEAETSMGAVCGAAVKAYRGDRAMLNEIMEFMEKLVEKYP